MRTLQATKRADILKAAARVFAAQGYHGTLVDDVAGRAGIGKGTIYRYFRDKEDLFFSILDSGLDRLQEAMEQAGRHPAPPAGALKAMVSAQADFVLNNRPLLKLLPEIGDQERKKRAAAIHRHNKRIAAVIEDAIRRGIGSGLLRKGDPQFWARALMMVCMAAFRDCPRAKKRQMVDDVLALFLHGASLKK